MTDTNSDTPDTTATPESNRLAILYMLGTVLAFLGMDTVLKLMAESYPVPQVVFLRALFGALMVLIVVAVFGLWAQVRPNRPILLFSRGLFGALMLSLFVFAVTQMSLTDAYAIAYAGPIFVTALSAPLLGERIGPWRWAAVGIGFLGILIMLQPGGSMLGLGGLAMLGVVIIYALNMIVLRKLKDSESPMAMSLLMSLGMLCAVAIPAYLVWQPVDWGAHGAFFLITGIIGTTAHYLIAQAFRRADVAVVAPFEYTGLVFAAMIDYWLWATVPGWLTWVGAAVVIGSGLLIIWRETVHRRPLASQGVGAARYPTAPITSEQEPQQSLPPEEATGTSPQRDSTSKTNGNTP